MEDAFDEDRDMAGLSLIATSSSDSRGGGSELCCCIVVAPRVGTT